MTDSNSSPMPDALPPVAGSARRKKRKFYRLEDRLKDYERWWLGKIVRDSWDGAPPIGRVTKIEVYGSPSGFTCVAEIHTDTGNRRMLPSGHGGMRPAKWELVVVPEPNDQSLSAP